MPTELGFIASNYYLKHTTAHKFHSELVEGMTFRDILKLMSDA